MPKKQERAKVSRCIRKVRKQGKSKEAAINICGASIFGPKKPRKKKRS